MADRNVTNPVYEQDGLYADLTQNEPGYLDVSPKPLESKLAGSLSKDDPGEDELYAGAELTMFQNPAYNTLNRDKEAYAEVDADKVADNTSAKLIKLLKRLQWASLAILFGVVVIIILLLAGVGQPSSTCGVSSEANTLKSESKNANFYDSDEFTSLLGQVQLLVHGQANLSASFARVFSNNSDSYITNSSGANIISLSAIYNGIADRLVVLQGGFSLFNRTVNSLSVDMRSWSASSSSGGSTSNNDGSVAASSQPGTCGLELPNYCAAAGPSVRQGLQSSFAATREGGRLTDRLLNDSLAARMVEMSHPHDVMHTFAIGTGGRVIFLLNQGMGYQVMDDFVRSAIYPLPAANCHGNMRIGSLRVVNRADGSRLLAGICDNMMTFFLTNASAPPSQAITLHSSRAFLSTSGIKSTLFYDVSETTLVYRDYLEVDGYADGKQAFVIGDVDFEHVPSDNILTLRNERIIDTHGQTGTAPKIIFDMLVVWWAGGQFRYVRLDDANNVHQAPETSPSQYPTLRSIFTLGSDLAVAIKESSGTYIYRYDLSTGYTVFKSKSFIEPGINEGTNLFLWQDPAVLIGSTMSNCSYLLPVVHGSSQHCRVMVITSIVTGAYTKTSWFQPSEGRCTVDVWADHAYVNIMGDRKFYNL